MHACLFLPSFPSSLFLHHVRTQLKMAICKPGKEVLLETELDGTLILHFSASKKPWEVNFGCSRHPVYGILLWKPEQMNILTEHPIQELREL